MPVFSNFIPKLKCRHGALKGRCFVEGCEHFCNLGSSDPARYFGARSSSAEAARLMKESPAKYHELRQKAVELKLLFF